MARPEAARWTEMSRVGEDKAQRTTGLVRWPLAAVMALMALLTACSGTGGSSASATGAPATTKTVPMTVIRNGQSTVETVPVYVDGHGPYAFLLDTGSSVSSVSGRLVTALHLPKTGNHAQIKDVAASKKVSIVRIRSWKVGHVSLTPEKVAVLSSSSTSGSVMGLLGSDELSHFAAVTENFQHGQLRLTSP